MASPRFWSPLFGLLLSSLLLSSPLHEWRARCWPVGGGHAASSAAHGPVCGMAGRVSAEALYIKLRVWLGSAIQGKDSSIAGWLITAARQGMCAGSFCNYAGCALTDGQTSTDFKTKMALKSLKSLLGSLRYSKKMSLRYSKKMKKRPEIIFSMAFQWYWYSKPMSLAGLSCVGIAQKFSLISTI